MKKVTKFVLLEANEMPWEEIEQQLRKSGAVKFVTAKNARRQQLPDCSELFGLATKNGSVGS